MLYFYMNIHSKYMKITLSVESNRLESENRRKNIILLKVMMYKAYSLFAVLLTLLVHHFSNDKKAQKAKSTILL